MAVKLTNEKGFSLSVAVWLGDDEYNHSPVGGPYISVTGLLKPLRMIVLDQRVRAAQALSDVDEVMDLDRFVPSRLGTAIHEAIEHSWTRLLKDGTPAYKRTLLSLGYPSKVIDCIRVNPTSEELDSVKGIIPIFMEKRAYKKVGKYTIGGQYDFVGNGNLEDFKSMGVYGYMKGDKDEEQALQGSLYRWLNPDIITSDTMKIQQIFTDWSKLEAMKGAKRGYPQARILEKKLALKDMDTWVNNRVSQIDGYMDTPETELPKCTMKELWQDKPVYKYYKNPDKTNGRSTRNFDDYHEAHARFLKDNSVGTIVENVGMVKRCGYCNAFDICTQKDEYIEKGVLKMP